MATTLWLVLSGERKLGHIPSVTSHIPSTHLKDCPKGWVGVWDGHMLWFRDLVRLRCQEKAWGRWGWGPECHCLEGFGHDP